jgi:nuclear pore complex protein Nup205
LHVLTNKGHFEGVSELLDIPFGTDFEYEEDEFTAFREVGQSPMRVIDLFQSLMFDWADSLSVEPISLQYLGSLNLQSCIRRDATGCEIVDRTTLLNLLSAAKRTVHAQGGVATSAQNDRLSSEISYILESCAIENHRRQVSHARVGGFEAWR